MPHCHCHEGSCWKMFSDNAFCGMYDVAIMGTGFVFLTE